MKKLYWRPSKVSWKIHLLIAILAAAGMTSVEVFRNVKRQRYYLTKIRAANTMKRGMDTIKAHRVARFGPLDTEVDPAASGMIGSLISPITSLVGHLEAKRTSANPNWAAVVVQMLKRAGVKKGDLVAMGFSGSFPSINLAALAAAEAMNAKVIAVSSASASAWGANNPEFTWLDMERLLFERRVVRHRSVAASLGGLWDRAVGMKKSGRDLLKTVIERNEARFIHQKTIKEAIDARMAIYREAAAGRPIAAYVNVGGGTVSVGSQIGKRLYRAGLNRRPPRRALKVDSVMTRFAKQRVPVIHLVRIEDLAKKFRLPVVPPKVPPVGAGDIYAKKEYNLYLAVTVLILLIGALYAFVKIDVGYRIFGTGRPADTQSPPEQMV